MITTDGRHDMEGTVLINRKGDKRTLFWWKRYLDRCASYHTFFSEDFLTDSEESDDTMTGRCNAGATVTKIKGTYGDFQMWLNKKGIANLISIPMLEASGYIVSTHTHTYGVVTNPEGKDITFNSDKGYALECPTSTSVKEGLVMIETVRKIWEVTLQRKSKGLSCPG